jgi:aerobic carbon-monoxide dehydrogenase medium subunit
MSGLTLHEPTTVEEAVEALRHDGARPIAGGTALVQIVKQGLYDFSSLVSLRRVAGLQRIGPDGDELVIGAMATLWDVVAAPPVGAVAPGLTEAVRAVGNVRIRSMGTLGGNLCYADPHCDPPAALLVLGAHAIVASPGGRRSIALADYFRGYYETAQVPGELLVEVRIPRQAEGTRAVYVRYTFASEEDWPCVAVAAAARVEGRGFVGLRVALAGVADRPLLVRGLATAVPVSAAGDVAELAARQSEPVSDLRGSEAYKREMVRVHTRRALARLADAAAAA